MKYLSTAYTYFSISGKYLDPDNFLDIFDIASTRVGEGQQGEKFLEYKIEAKDANEGLEEAIYKLMKSLAPKSQKIKAYASHRDLYIKIFVVIHVKNAESNGVFLNKHFIKFLNEIGAEIEIDTYNYS